MAENELKNEVILVLDTNDGTSKVISGLDDKKKRPMTVPSDSPLEEFMKITGNDMAENFVKNYIYQFNNPAGVITLVVPEEKVPELTEQFKKYNADKTAENFAPFEEYKVTYGRKRGFEDHEIPWEALKDFGLSEEYIRKNGWDKVLMVGDKTPVVKIKLQTPTGVIFEGEGRVSLRRQDDKVLARGHGLRSDMALKEAFFGYEFTDEDRAALKETGHIGKVVQLINYKTQEKIDSLISLDPETHEPVPMRVSNVFITDKLYGRDVTQEEKDIIRSGGEVFMKDCVDFAGEKYDAYVRANAATGQLQRRYPEGNIPKIFCGVKMTEEQYKDFCAGKPVDMGELKNKEGRTIPPVVTWDSEKNKPKFDYRSEQKKEVKQAETAEVKAEQAPAAKEEVKKSKGVKM